MKYLLVVILSVFSFQAEKIDLNNFNEEKINQLVFEEINKVRVKKGLKALKIHPTLFKAAELQSSYMLDKSKMTHEQKSKKYKDPQSRVAASGKEQARYVAENVAYFDVLLPVKVSYLNNKEVFIEDYETLAEYFVKGWVQSPGHNKNLMNTYGDFTGVACKLDKEKRRVYVTQVFGGF